MSWNDLRQRLAFNDDEVLQGAGPHARALAGRSDAERVRVAVDALPRVLEMDPVRLHNGLRGGFSHDWQGDPFSRGAYSYVVVGGKNARATLAAPVDGTLFFAGEATSDDSQGGTVNGALETGLRAAREAAMSLGVTVQ